MIGPPQYFRLIGAALWNGGGIGTGRESGAIGMTPRT
jgi:hypothetical protein